MTVAGELRRDGRPVPVLIVHSQQPGEATATGTRDGRPYESSDSFYVSGAVTADGDRLEFWPR